MKFTQTPVEPRPSKKTSNFRAAKDPLQCMQTTIDQETKPKNQTILSTNTPYNTKTFGNIFSTNLLSNSTPIPTLNIFKIFTISQKNIYQFTFYYYIFLP